MAKILMGRTYSDDVLTTPYIAPAPPNKSQPATRVVRGHLSYEYDGLTLTWPNIH